MPNLDKLAQITGEQVVNIGSQDMSDEVWLKLAKSVAAASADGPGNIYNGVAVAISPEASGKGTLVSLNDDEMGFVASGELNPAKSRVLLQLALTQTSDPKRIREMFYEL